jgi:hypothetical protein
MRHVRQMFNILLCKLISRGCEGDVRGSIVDTLVRRHLGRVFGGDGRCLDGLICDWGYRQFFCLHGGLLGDFVRGRLVGHL